MSGDLHKMSHEDHRTIATTVVLKGGQVTDREDRKGMIESEVCRFYGISGWSDSEFDEYATPQDVSYMDFLVRTAKVTLETEDE